MNQTRPPVYRITTRDPGADYAAFRYFHGHFAANDASKVLELIKPERRPRLAARINGEWVPATIPQPKGTRHAHK